MNHLILEPHPRLIPRQYLEFRLVIEEGLWEDVNIRILTMHIDRDAQEQVPFSILKLAIASMGRGVGEDATFPMEDPYH